MANQQVRDVIRAVRSFHHQLAAIYQSSSDHAGRERLRMLLHYMSRHEQNLEECLLKFEQEGAPRVLDYWFRVKTREDILTELQHVHCHPAMEADEIIDTALAIDAKLVAFYKDLADHGDNEEVRELFGALYQMERKYDGILVRDAIALEQQ